MHAGTTPVSLGIFALILGIGFMLYWFFKEDDHKNLDIEKASRSTQYWLFLSLGLAFILVGMISLIYGTIKSHSSTHSHDYSKPKFGKHHHDYSKPKSGKHHHDYSKTKHSRTK